MRRSLAASIFLAIAFTTFAADGQPEKLAAAGWIANYERGVAVAREADKPIFLVFRCER